jgi:hypothetical protein
MNMPEGLKYWTADEVAECLSGIGPDLCSKLWDILSAAKNPTPLGGDGSNGTVEEPHERYDEDHDDKATHWWAELTAAEQTTIAAAYVADQGGPS